MHAIIAEVADKYDVSYSDLVSARRQRIIVHPRQEAYWRCKVETTHSLPEIGRAFGGRDHTTVMKGIEAHLRRLSASTTQNV